MPVYFFNVRGRIVQSQRKELPDKDAAWREASVQIGELLRDLMDGGKTVEFEFEVTDELKSRVYLISIGSHEFVQADCRPRGVSNSDRSEGVIPTSA